MTEVFRDIEGYEGFYQVSNLGRVKSITRDVNSKANSKMTIQGQIIKPQKKFGYLTVHLDMNGARKYVRVHRLVAKAFIPNPDNLPYVNHKDECKTNNTVENLEWCTNEYNVHYGTAIQRRSKNRKRPVICVETGEVFNGAVDVENKLGFSRMYIGMCCRGKKPTAYGYHWNFT